MYLYTHMNFALWLFRGFHGLISGIRLSPPLDIFIFFILYTADLTLTEKHTNNKTRRRKQN